MFIFLNDSLDLYQENFSELIKQIKNGEGELIDKLRRSRNQSIKRIQQKSLTNEHFLTLLNSLNDFLLWNDNIKYIQKEASKIFKVHNGQYLPYINDDGLLKRECRAKPSEIILELPVLDTQLKLEAEEIIAKSSFSEKHRFRTIMKDGLPIIMGNDDCNLYSLLGLAHELGHCLYEKRIDRQHYLAPYYSEAVAHLFEEIVVNSYLQLYEKPEILQLWHQYQRKLDLLNIYFFIFEWQKFITNLKVPNYFNTPYILLRESYYVLPGFQSVYGYASIKKLEIMKTNNIQLDQILGYFAKW